tara:strand:+ start:200 stop:775 length:576 start_codon:yes stop_codon:yes gene_type:complete
MVLLYCDIKVEIREILLKDRPKELYETSPKGTVPVLCISSTNIIDESIDIMHWANEFAKQDLFDINIKNQEEFIKMNDLKLKFWLDRYKYSERYPEESKQYYREECKKYLSILDNNLKVNLFLTGNKMQLADIAIFPFLRQFAHVDKENFENDFSYLYKYLNFFLKSDLFLRAMTKYTLWSKESNKIFNIT